VVGNIPAPGGSWFQLLQQPSPSENILTRIKSLIEFFSGFGFPNCPHDMVPLLLNLQFIVANFRRRRFFADSRSVNRASPTTF
jgi:hypothetical protein